MEPILQTPGCLIRRGSEQDWPPNPKPGSVFVIAGHPTDIVLLDARQWYEPIEDEL